MTKIVLMPTISEITKFLIMLNFLVIANVTNSLIELMTDLIFIR
jgi:hypothetical protein